MRTARIGLLGLGHVGSAVASALDQLGPVFAQRTGVVPVLTRIAVRHLEKPRPVVVDANLLTDNAWAIVRDPRVDVVVEAIGGISPAGAFLEEALRNGKNVVTANKQLVGSRGREFELLAASTERVFAYEASVGGAVPVIRLVQESLLGDRVTSLTAIINGTANYILTRMEEGVSFEDAQVAAQELGLAEPDPSDDLDGHDAAAKLAILASLAFDTSIQPEQITHLGIRHISFADIRQAKAAGAVVRLLAVARRDGIRIEAGVFPGFVPLSHPLARIRNEQNGILLHTELAGELFIHGRGAGGRPTASAILADLATAVGPRAIRRSLPTPEVIPLVPTEWATIPLPNHNALDLISSS
jgi:homoserine dehydrogenase